jgi:methionyl aminopeptidase
VSAEAARLIEATKQSFYEALGAVKVGGRIGDIGAAVDGYIRSQGFSVVRQYVGHGIGRDVHEQPDVPNYGTPGRGPRLCNGLVIAIEPMVNVGNYAVRQLDDGWTVKTADGSLSAHYENTVALTEDGVLNLTEVE